MSCMLKCAGINNYKDISHGAKELVLHKMWSRLILEEFYRQVNFLFQGDLE